MKKLLVVLITLLGLFAAFSLGSYSYFKYFFNPQPPKQVLTSIGAEIYPLTYSWHSPFAGGLLYKDHYDQAKEPSPIDLGVIHGGLPEFEPVIDVMPQGNLRVDLKDESNNTIWSGENFDFPKDLVRRNGDYEMNATLTYPRTIGRAYGELFFAATFRVYFEPNIISSFPEVAQGDAFVIRLYDLQDKPSMSIDAGKDSDGNPIMAVFTKTGKSSAEAIVAVAHDRPMGEYNVHVDCDESSWDLVYTVKEGRFERQDLSIDTSSPQITEANSPAAYEQYREKVYPLYETADDQRYWEGSFIRPVDWEAKLCRISSTYGIFRYTNGNPTPRRHPALDIAAPNGTPVLAPNNGRVVMAEYLLNTGNTMVIEYGGGLKSYFFHLSSMAVSTGDMVEKGQEIAKVGSTGYSTGPHLHFEMRVGRQSLDPMLLMNGQSAIFF